jgi:hypothetical protein
MHFVSVEDKHGKAAIRADSIDAIITDNDTGVTTIYFAGAQHQTEATHNRVTKAVDAALEEQFNSRMNDEGWFHVDTTPTKGSE